MKQKRSLMALFLALVTLSAMILFSDAGTAEEPDDPKAVPPITQQLPAAK
jgi:hypothetical protein